MNNCEKKLDALIDALGFDVEEVAVSDSLCRDTIFDYKLTKRDDKLAYLESICGEDGLEDEEI